MTKETNNHEGLKHGEYKIKQKKIDNDKKITLVEAIVRPITQEEMADGWIQISSKNIKIIHHFSIYLSQLPINLWSRLKRTYTQDKNKDYYQKIKDNNYQYTIKYTINDEKTFELYRNIMSKTPNLDKINELYRELDENRVKGWIMIRSLNMLNK